MNCYIRGIFFSDTLVRHGCPDGVKFRFKERRGTCGHMGRHRRIPACKADSTAGRTSRGGIPLTFFMTPGPPKPAVKASEFFWIDDWKTMQ